MEEGENTKPMPTRWEMNQNGGLHAEGLEESSFLLSLSPSLISPSLTPLVGWYHWLVHLVHSLVQSLSSSLPIQTSPSTMDLHTHLGCVVLPSWALTRLGRRKLGLSGPGEGQNQEHRWRIQHLQRRQSGKLSHRQTKRKKQWINFYRDIFGEMKKQVRVKERVNERFREDDFNLFRKADIWTINC